MEGVTLFKVNVQYFWSAFARFCCWFVCSQSEGTLLTSLVSEKCRSMVVVSWKRSHSDLAPILLDIFRHSLSSILYSMLGKCVFRIWIYVRSLFSVVKVEEKHCFVKPCVLCHVVVGRLTLHGVVCMMFILCVGISIDILLSILNYLEIRARSYAVGTRAHVKFVTWGMTSNGIANIIW